MELVPLLIALLGYVVGAVVLYYIIKGAVLAALREHTVNSTTAVIVRDSVPITIKTPDE